MAPYALLNTLVPPSGVSHSVFLPFAPSCHYPLPARPSSFGFSSPPGRVVTNLVVARGRRLRVFEVREEESELEYDAVERARREGDVVKTEAGDAEGGGFDMGGGNQQLALRSSNATAGPPKSLRLHHVLSHTLHGSITGLGAVQTVSSIDDGLSRLMVSYEHAKMAILEWNDSSRSLQTVSLHTYERTPQVAQADLTGYISLLRMDPDSRCAVLLLPGNSMAVLPILASEADFELEEDAKNRKEIPYSPSYVVQLSDLDTKINNVKDLTFLPGFHSPTIAVLYENLQSWANRPEERDTFILSLHTIDPSSSTGQTSYPLIASIPNLPSSSLCLFPCPPQISGVILLSPNAIIHIDPSGNTVATAVNAYHHHESSLSAETLPNVSGLRLEGAQVVFLDEGKKGLLVLSDGRVRELGFEKEGRMLVKIVVGEDDCVRVPSPGGAICGVALGADEGECLFVGSLLGDGSVMRVGRKNAKGLVQSLEIITDASVDDGMDLDDDLYGPSTTISNRTTLNPHLSSVLSSIPSGPAKLQIELCDTLKDHGSLQSLTFGTGPQTKIDPPNDPQLFALAGSGHSSSFNYLHRDMPALKKRKLSNLSGSRGIWSLRVPVPTSSNGRIVSSTASRIPEKDTVLVVDEDHESGHTKIFSFPSTKNEPQIVRRIPAATVSAGEFFQRTCIAHVTTTSISLVEGDGRERQTIKNETDSCYASASVSDPYIFAQRTDGSTALFVGDTLKGTLSELPVTLDSPRCFDSLIYTDTSGIFSTTPRSKTKPVTANDEFGLYGNSEEEGGVDAKMKTEVATLESTMDSGRGTQWLVTMGSSGTLEIRSLPDLSLAFSSPSFATLPSSLSDEPAPSTSGSADPTHLSEPPFHQMTIAMIGERSPEPHLLLLTNAGHLTIYSINPLFSPTPSSSSSSSDPSPPRPSLQVNLVKTLSRVIRPPDDPDSDEPIVPWSLRPFSNLQGKTGLFLTGDLPFWIMKSETSGVMLYSVDERMVHAFEKSTMYGGKTDYLLTNDEGCNLLSFPSDIQVGQPQPVKRLVSERTYTHVTFDPPSQHLVAAGLFSVPFEIFDEDENRVEHKSHDPKLLPLSERSSLELINFATSEIIDGYEFADNETILALESVNLETKSVPSGRKDYIAVGTGISRGEDLSERGATYIFEIVEVVPEPGQPQRKHRLKLLCQDDSKGAVTALANINGYLVSSMAHKVYIRGFDYDERLLGLAFLDVSIFVTSIRVMKNLIILGDIVRSVTFLAFQEEPYKLVALSKDYRNLHITSGNFLFGYGQLGLVVLDQEGDLRMMEFNPTHPESEGGLKLVYKSEMHVATEISSVVTIARRTTEQELIAPQSQLLLAGVDGSISTLIAVPEQTYKRLALLQGQLLRSIQQVSGLNPRAFRIVRNDTAPRPLSKGILDGDLLYSTFELLPRPVQEMITKQIGTSVDEVLDDLEELRAVW